MLLSLLNLTGNYTQLSVLSLSCARRAYVSRTLLRLPVRYTHDLQIASTQPHGRSVD